MTLRDGHRVLLDANVLLSGALSPLSNASELRRLTTQAQFIVPQSVLDESRSVIEKKASSVVIKDMANYRLNAYLRDLKAIIVPSPLVELEGHDAHVKAAAERYECGLICTYNVKDFEDREVTAIPPLAVQRHFDFEGTAIEYPVLGREGTLLVRARFHGNRTMGRILADRNGTEVASPRPGEIVVVGDDVECRVHHAFPEGYGLNFVFRYESEGQFEAAAWAINGEWPTGIKSDSSGKLLLTTGRARFEPPVRPLLVFGKNYGFAGSLFGISGIDQHIKDRNMGPVLASGTLEGVGGGGDASLLLNDFEVLRSPDRFRRIVLRVRDRRTRTVAPRGTPH